MTHLFVLYYILAFSVGVFCLGCLYTVARNNKNELIKSYLVCYLFFVLFIFSILLRNYFILVLNQDNGLVIVMQFLCIMFSVYMLAYLANKIFLVPKASIINLIILLFLVATLSVYTFQKMFMYKLGLPRFLGFIKDEYSYIIIFTYIIIIYFLYHKNITSKLLGEILRFAFLITLLLIPGVIFDEYFNPGGLKVIFAPLFFIIISIFSISSIFKYSNSIQNIKFAISKDFCLKYGITDRETEVILLLLKGYSYNKIAEELVISLSTVRTHVTNIYKKVGINSRYELTNMLT